MNQLFSDATLRRLQERLKHAEALTRTTLAGARDENPLIEPTRQLLAVHEDIQALLVTHGPQANVQGPLEGEIAKAAIQIEREEHTLKPDAKDILKAFFMWKDDPAERVRKEAQ